VIGALARRERVTLALGGTVALIVGGWLLLVQPIQERSSLAEELVPVREQLLERRRELVARQAAIAADLEGTNAQLEALSARFLPAGTPAVAASELQKLVKDVAVQAKTEVRSERILPPVERGDLLEIPLEITVSGEIRQLVDLLAHLAQAPKLLAVQDLRIRVVNVSQPKDLLTTLTLSGFIVSGRAKA
jgi:Tfp pilus assembly protein PilO